MKPSHLLTVSGAALSLLCAAPASQAFAQMADSAADGAAVDTNAVVSADHGNWTLKQREDWLSDRLHTARDDGSVDGAEFDRVNHELDHIKDAENQMRGDHDGQLTDNETTVLEARLDGVADQIHWLHEDKFRKPW